MKLIPANVIHKVHFERIESKKSICTTCQHSDMLMCWHTTAQLTLIVMELCVNVLNANNQICTGNFLWKSPIRVS